MQARQKDRAQREQRAIIALLPSLILYSNPLTGFSSREIRNLFQPMTPDAARALTEGDYVWSFQQQGKIYGYGKCCVRRKTTSSDGFIQLYFDGKGYAGMTPQDARLYFFTIRDNLQLAELVEKYPLSTRVYG